MAAFIPTETGLILIHDSCEHNLYELRGETFATLKWIKVTQQLPNRANFYSVGFPLPDDAGVCTCNEGYSGDKCDSCADGWFMINGVCQGKFTLFYRYL